MGNLWKCSGKCSPRVLWEMGLLRGVLRGIGGLQEVLPRGLNVCLDSPFFASLSVHGLHFTVYAPSNTMGRQVGGGFRSGLIRGAPLVGDLQKRSAERGSPDRLTNGKRSEQIGTIRVLEGSKGNMPEEKGIGKMP